MHPGIDARRRRTHTHKPAPSTERVATPNCMCSECASATAHDQHLCKDTTQ
jgi:hypothetical protein